MFFINHPDTINVFVGCWKKWNRISLMQKLNALQQLSFFSWSIVFHVTGALTKGDRRAASGADLTEFNFDTPYGRNALRAMYQSVCTVSRLLVLEPMVSLNSFRNIVKICISLLTSPYFSLHLIVIGVSFELSVVFHLNINFYRL